MHPSTHAYPRTIATGGSRELIESVDQDTKDDLNAPVTPCAYNTQALMALHISPSPVKGSSSMSATSGAIPGAWSTKGTTPLLQPRSSQSQSWCPEDERLIDTTPAIGISTAWGREDVLFITQEQRMMMSAALRSALSVTDSLLDALWNARNSGCQLSRSTHEHNGTHQLLAALDAKRELFEGTDVFPESCERAQELRRSVSNFSLSLSPPVPPSLPPSLPR